MFPTWIQLGCDLAVHRLQALVARHIDDDEHLNPQVGPLSTSDASAAATTTSSFDYALVIHQQDLTHKRLHADFQLLRSRLKRADEEFAREEKLFEAKIDSRIRIERPALDMTVERTLNQLRHRLERHASSSPATAASAATTTTTGSTRGGLRPWSQPLASTWSDPLLQSRDDEEESSVLPPVTADVPDLDFLQTPLISELAFTGRGERGMRLEQTRLQSLLRTAGRLHASLQSFFQLYSGCTLDIADIRHDCIGHLVDRYEDDRRRMSLWFDTQAHSQQERVHVQQECFRQESVTLRHAWNRLYQDVTTWRDALVAHMETVLELLSIFGDHFNDILDRQPASKEDGRTDKKTKESLMDRNHSIHGLPILLVDTKDRSSPAVATADPAPRAPAPPAPPPPANRTEMTLEYDMVMLPTDEGRVHWRKAAQEVWLDPERHLPTARERLLDAKHDILGWRAGKHSTEYLERLVDVWLTAFYVVAGVVADTRHYIFQLTTTHQSRGGRLREQQHNLQREIDRLRADSTDSSASTDTRHASHQRLMVLMPQHRATSEELTTWETTAMILSQWYNKAKNQSPALGSRLGEFIAHERQLHHARSQQRDTHRRNVLATRAQTAAILSDRCHEASDATRTFAAAENKGREQREAEKRAVFMDRWTEWLPHMKRMEREINQYYEEGQVDKTINHDMQQVAALMQNLIRTFEQQFATIDRQYTVHELRGLVNHAWRTFDDIVDLRVTTTTTATPASSSRTSGSAASGEERTKERERSIR